MENMSNNSRKIWAFFYSSLWLFHPLLIARDFAHHFCHHRPFKLPFLSTILTCSNHRLDLGHLMAKLFQGRHQLVGNSGDTLLNYFESHISQQIYVQSQTNEFLAISSACSELNMVSPELLSPELLRQAMADSAQFCLRITLYLDRLVAIQSH